MTPDEIREAAIGAAAQQPDLIAAVSDRLWSYYYAGVVADGIWCDAGMRDAEELAGLLGIEERTDDEEVRARLEEFIPKECRRIARAAVDAYEAAMWQPIETAIPELGERLWVKTARYDGEAHWCEYDDELRLYWANMGPGEYVDGIIDDATHWQPLPQPPEQKT